MGKAASSVMVVLCMLGSIIGLAHAEGQGKALTLAERNRLLLVKEQKPWFFSKGKPCSIVVSHDMPAYEGKDAVKLIETLGFYPNGMLKSQHFERNGKKDPHKMSVVEYKNIIYLLLVELGKRNANKDRLRSRADGYDILYPITPYGYNPKEDDELLGTIRYTARGQYTRETIDAEGQVIANVVREYDHNGHLEKHYERKPDGALPWVKYYKLRTQKSQTGKVWVYDEFITIQNSKNLAPQRVGTLTYSQFDVVGNPTKVVAQYPVVAGHRKQPLMVKVRYAYDYCSPAPGE